VSARRGGGRRGRHGGGGHGGGNHERWLLTYADMITLLLALFIVLLSMATVDERKLEPLKNSLTDAFSGHILPGGKSIQAKGASETSQSSQNPPQAPVPAITPPTPQTPNEGKSQVQQSATKEQEDLEKVKKQVDELVKDKNLQKKLETEVARRGLVIRILTDDVLFDSGQAELKSAGAPLLDHIATLLKQEIRHPIVVEGYTDKQPIASSKFPTNWELSTSRAAAVVRLFIRDGIPAPRLGASGYAALHPIASNSTASGRSRNRRVEIVLVRQNEGPQDGGSR
jgi:chemotaxis protein MotB